MIEARGALRAAGSPADLRLGQRWTPGQCAKNALLAWVALGVLFVARRLPRRALLALGVAIGEIAYRLLPAARRTARANVCGVFPERDPIEREALVHASYRRLGRHLGDVVALLGGAPLEPIAIAPTARETLARALAAGRGVLFVSAHLGPWERVAGSLVAAGFPLTTLAREAYDPRLTVIYDRLRGALGVGVVYRSAGGTTAAAVRIVRALRGGGLLGVPMDLRSRVPSVEAPFLGRPASTAVGPARLALRTGAAVVVGTIAPGARAGGEVVLTATRIPTADLRPGKAGDRALTGRINDELSRRIAALPEEWVWMHPRWPAPSPAAPPLAAEDVVLTS